MIFLYKDISKNVPKFEKGSRRLRVNGWINGMSCIYSVGFAGPKLKIHQATKVGGFESDLTLKPTSNIELHFTSSMYQHCTFQ